MYSGYSTAEPAGGEMVKPVDPLLAGKRGSLDAVGQASIAAHISTRLRALIQSLHLLHFLVTKNSIGPR